jgi:thiol-disulfide isomerase/thioredoxin
MRIFKTSRTWIIGVAVVSLVVAACGGGGGDSSQVAEATPATSPPAAATPISDVSPGIPLELGLIDTPVPKGLKKGTRVGNVAHNFRLETPEGETIVLSDLRGKPVLLNFWATWCGPCRFEMPELQELHERIGDQVQVIAVDLDESADDVTEYFEDLGLTFPSVIDEGQDVANKYALFGLPSTFILDENGVVAVIKVGPFANQDDLNKNLEKVGL